MGANVTYTGAGGGKRAGIQNFLLGSGPIRAAIRVGDMGPDALDGTDPQGLPSHGGPLLYGEIAMETS